MAVFLRRNYNCWNFISENVLSFCRNFQMKKSVNFWKFLTTSCYLCITTHSHLIYVGLMLHHAACVLNIFGVSVTLNRLPCKIFLPCNHLFLLLLLLLLSSWLTLSLEKLLQTICSTWPPTKLSYIVFYSMLLLTCTIHVHSWNMHWRAGQ